MGNGDELLTFHLCVSHLHRLPKWCHGMTRRDVITLAAYDQIVNPPK